MIKDATYVSLILTIFAFCVQACLITEERPFNSLSPQYLQLHQFLTDEERTGSVFPCGLRSTAEIDLNRNRFGRSATSPVDILNELDIVVNGMETKTVKLYPNHVGKTHQMNKNITAQSLWFAPP